ncbi:pyrin-like [Melanotaenia boesemani]|uniref:pyrin-like n=1 Tax=Melanotaenia boesemani TaxID=1250792 RepID=UPI001C03D80E|nr:pyrin-like [Melanotaenia boesemani]
MMTAPKEDLWKTLSDLTEKEFKLFKWFLKEGDSENSFSGIPVARLEGADRLDTVDVMVQKYCGPGALQKSTEILEKISRNDLVKRLSDMSSRWRDLKNLESDSDRQKAKAAQMKAGIRLMIQERQLKISEIQHSAEISRKSADQQTSDSMQVFTVLMQLVQKSLENLKEQIEEKQKTTQRQAERIIQGLEQEISELNKREGEIENLVHTEDDLQNISTTENLPLPSYGTTVMTTVNELKEKLNKEMERFLNKAKLNRIQQFAVHVTLDALTAHPNLVLSDDGKQVRFSKRKQNLPDNPERFSSAVNVLGKQSFSSGRFYFEVQVKGKTARDLGVVKESISRKGSITASPEGGHWTICLRGGDKYKASSVHLSVTTPPHKVGVFVDYEKKSVGFYNVDSADLIHCFSDCLFTEKLYPFFSPSLHHGGLNVTPLIICPVSYTD